MLRSLLLLGACCARSSRAYIALRVHHSRRRPLQHRGSALASTAAAADEAAFRADDDAFRADDDRLLLIDGSGVLYRSFYATQRAGLTRPSDGAPIGGVLGVANLLAEELLPALVAAARGGGGAPPRPRAAWVADRPEPTFRHEAFAAYKAQRASPPDALRAQFAPARAAVAAFGVPLLDAAGFEADDVIASVAHAARGAGAGGAPALRCEVLSADKDLWQLCAAPHVRVRSPVDKPPRALVGRARVRAKHGVEAAQLEDLLALCGDAVDNVPGVPGIGPKSAAKLLAHCGSLDAALGALDGDAASSAGPLPLRKGQLAALRAARDDGSLATSRALIALRTDAPLPCAPRDLVVEPLDLERILGFCDENGFEALRRRVLRVVN